MKFGLKFCVAVLLLALGLASCAKATPTPPAKPAATPVAAPTPAPAVITPAPATPAVPRAVAPTPAPVTPPPAIATPSSTPAPTPAKPTGELNVALASLMRERLDPTQEDRAGVWTTLGLIYDPLISINPDGSLAPGIAEKWEMAPDGKSWTFYIRKGVQFHDGWGEVTAEDVKFSLELFMSPESTSSFADSLRMAIQGIQVVEPYMVVVITKGTQPFFPYQVSAAEGGEAAVMSKKYYQQGGKDAFARRPIGSGPWKFVRHVAGDRIEYEAIDDLAFYKNHFRKMPAFKKLTLLLVPEESSRVAMLRKGEVDIIEVGAGRVQELKGAGLQVRSIPYGFQVGTPVFGTYRTEVATSPLAKLGVRKALSLAINRDEIIRGFFYGYAEPTLPWLVTPYGADVDAAYWKKYSEEAYRYDPQEAKRLLAQAGYPDGFAIRIHSYAMPGRGYLPELAQLLAMQWAKIGVKATIDPMDWPAYIAEVRKRPQPAKIIGAVSSFAAPTRYVMGPSMPTYFSGKVGVFLLMNDTEAEQMMTAYMAEPDDAKRLKLATELIRKTADSYTMLPIAYPSVLMGTGPKVGEWQLIAGHPYLALVYETIKPAK